MQLTAQKNEVQQSQRSESAGTVVCAAAKIYLFYLKLRNSLGRHWAMITDYVSPELEDADDVEQEWTADAVLSVLYVIDGEDPYETFCRMTPGLRLEALRMISEVYAKMLGIPPLPVEVSENMEAGTLGVYRDVFKRILINSRLVDEQPISVETAKQAISCIIHETFHAYQYAAAFRPKQYGLDKTVAARWRENARNYCTVKENPVQYYLQPLEVYARFIEEGVQAQLNDTELVQILQAKINQMMQEGE